MPRSNRKSKGNEKRFFSHELGTSLLNGSSTGVCVCVGVIRDVSREFHVFIFLLVCFISWFREFFLKFSLDFVTKGNFVDD